MKLRSTFFSVGIVLALALSLTSLTLPANTAAQTDPVIIAPGFEFNIFAEPSRVPDFALSATTGPSCIAFDARGRLFVATLPGKILILLDNNDDGNVDQVKTFASGIPMPLGMAFGPNGDLFVTSNVARVVGRILRLRDTNADDVVDETATLIDGLPSAGDHQTDRLRFGPDGLLYFGQGSATDNGVPQPGLPGDGPLNAAILRLDVNKPGELETFATGLRNPFGIAFHPDNGELFSTDGGSGEICQLNCDGFEDVSPPDEVNWVVKGGNYGFPRCEGPPAPGNPNCSGVRAPVTIFNRHLTPTSVTFYTGPQAGPDRNQLFVTLLKRLGAQGGDLRRFTITGSAATGFQATEVFPRLVEFGIIDPFDGPLDTAIDPISGDIYAVRMDPVRHRDPNEHHHFIYRIHRTGSDLMPLIGPLRPTGALVGAGAVTVNLIGRHLKPGAVVLADGVQIPTRPGASVFDLTFDLPASATAGERSIAIEVVNPDGIHSNIQSFVVGRQPGGPPTGSPQISSLVLKKKSKVVESLPVGAKAKKFTLQVNGTNFDAAAELMVDGVALELVSSSSTALVGKLKKAMSAAAGALPVQVRNASGRTSNTLNLVVAANQ